jgi:hypothetical protein
VPSRDCEMSLTAWSAAEYTWLNLARENSNA